MLKTNLSTRPFYNERAVAWALALAFVAIVALTVFNVTRVLSLSARQASLSADVARQEARVQELNTQAARVRGSIDQKGLARVVAAAREANAIIDQRTFSWTELFNHFERTLPTGVMLTSVVPTIEEARDKKPKFLVQLTVVGRAVEPIDEFIEKLEATGAFSNALASQESVTEEGQIEASIQARYDPSAASPASDSDAATEDKSEDKPGDKAGEKSEDAPAGEATPEGVAPEKEGDAKGAVPSKPGEKAPAAPARPPRDVPKREAPPKSSAGAAAAAPDAARSEARTGGAS